MRKGSTIFASKRNRESDCLQVSVTVRKIYPDIPVGGRLQYFHQNWSKITDDKWVLSTIKNGYFFDFMQIPNFTGIKATNVSVKDQKNLDLEVQKLLEKHAVEIVPSSQALTGFYSTFFLVPKKNGKMRPVINLRPLNRYIRKEHFKMDTLTSVISLVQKGDWAISLDLEDAYLHIPIHKSHRKYLRFCLHKDGPYYQFRTLCFGPSPAPRIFTKIVSVIAAHLRSLGMRLATYLDDWFLLNQERLNLLSNREITLNLLADLGFLLNVEKSVLQPTQNIVYIGGHFQLNKALVAPTPDRVQNIQLAVQKFMKENVTARDFLHLLGLCASCILLIPHARLHMRPIQIHLLSFWRPSSQSLNVQVPVTAHLKSHLRWWLDTAHITQGKSLEHWKTTIVMTTDASNKGYGGHVNGQMFQGTWSEKEKNLHINCLEMEAVIKCLVHFLHLLENQCVLIRCDNSTVVQYINKQGGTRSVQTCYLAWKLWQIAIKHNVQLKAAHVAGHLNVLADNLSRVRIRATEWSLNDQMVQKIFLNWGQPMIDLFASVDNRKVQIFCSWENHSQAYAVDSLTIPWQNMFGYAYPPLCLIPRVLHHMSQCNCQIILIAPHWPRRHWYPTILQYLIACPLRLPNIKNLLVQPKTQIYHPKAEIFSLTAWLLSTDRSKQEAFLKTLENFSQPLGEVERRRTILSNSESMIAGVIQNKLIPILHL